MTTSVNSFLAKIFASEKNRFILWLPVVYGAGIALFFTLNFEPKLLYSGLLPLLILVLFAFFKFKRKETISRFLLIGFIFSLGFFVPVLKVHFISPNFILEKTEPVSIRAVIDSIEPQNTGVRIIFSNVDIWKWNKENTPEKIRLNVRTKFGEAKAGDRVSFRAILYPPPNPSYPGGYDSARAAFFKNIGAYGFTLSDIKIIEAEKKKDISTLIDNLRIKISAKILGVYKNEESPNKVSDKAAMAIALFVGEQNALSKNLIEKMRSSGLFHLVSISGLHMAIVMGTVFFTMRLILSFIPAIALKYNIKKWAAFASLFAGGFYLLISGAPVPAVRSYIMAALFFIAIIVNRTGSVLLPVAWAAFFILIIEPEAILSASFQMSFAAVTALAASFEVIRIFEKEFLTNAKLKKFLLYFVSIAFSSIIAGAATAPFVIYHFSQFQIYGIFSNLMAVPITSFIIMPFGMLALLLMPIGLHAPMLFIAGLGIDMVIKISEYVGALPSATISIKPFVLLAFTLITIGGLWLCLWRGNIRYAGFILIFAGLLIPKASVPDVVVDSTGKLFAVKADDGALYFSSLNLARSARSTWAEKNAVFDKNKIKLFPESEETKLSCGSDICFYAAEKKVALVNKEPEKQEIDNICESDLVFFLKSSSSCGDKNNAVNLEMLKNDGTHIVNFSDKKLIKTVSDSSGKRKWRAENSDEN